MAAEYALQFFALPALQNLNLLKAGFFSHGSHQFFGHEQSAGFGIHQNVHQLRMQGNCLIGRQGPGGGGPDEHVCRLIGGNLALTVGYRKLHINGMGCLIVILNLSLSQG